MQITTNQPATYCGQILLPLEEAPEVAVVPNSAIFFVFQGLQKCPQKKKWDWGDWGEKGPNCLRTQIHQRTQDAQDISSAFFFSLQEKKKTHVTLYPIRRFYVPENSISLLRAAPSVHVSLSGCHSHDIFGSFFHDIINFKGYTTYCTQ